VMQNRFVIEISRAFSSEVDTGSRQENASNQESNEAPPQTDEAC
jgi:hypothetical protein